MDLASPTALPQQNDTAPTSLTSVIDRVVRCAGQDKVRVQTVLAAMGPAGFAPVLLLPAVAVATPLSGIPLFSSLMGLVILLVSVQMLARRRHLWLPDWIMRRSVQGDRVAGAFRRLYPVARWIDARTLRRFRVIRRRPFVYLPQVLCALSGAMMPFLEFVPFSSSVLGVGVALLALGMLARDGLLILIGLIPYVIVAMLIFTALT